MRFFLADMVPCGWEDGDDDGDEWEANLNWVQVASPDYSLHSN